MNFDSSSYIYCTYYGRQPEKYGWLVYYYYLVEIIIIIITKKGFEEGVHLHLHNNANVKCKVPCVLVDAFEKLYGTRFSVTVWVPSVGLRAPSFAEARHV